MGKSIFIVGGARSGKSTYAVELAKKSGKKVVFLATCTYFDKEMKQRIKNHECSRPSSWKVITEGTDICRVIYQESSRAQIILLDCLGLWISNLMAESMKDAEILSEVERLATTLKEVKGPLIIVSNEVGCGLVPPYPSGRKFRDLLGSANQIMAKSADQVYLMQVGLPLQLK